MTKKFYRFDKTTKELFDYDYFKTLSEEDKKWLLKFHDEEYNGTYNNDYKNSVFFNSNEFLKVKDTQEFLILLKKENKKRKEKGYNTLSQKQFFCKLQQRNANNNKKDRQADVFNKETNMTNGVNKTFEAGFTKQITKDRVKKFDNDDVTDVDTFEIKEKTEQDILYKHIIERTVHFYVAEKLIEFYDEKEHPKKLQIIKKIKDNIEMHKQHKIKKLEFIKLIYKLFIATSLLFKNEKELEQLQKVYNVLIFPNQNKDINRLYK